MSAASRDRLDLALDLACDMAIECMRESGEVMSTIYGHAGANVLALPLQDETRAILPTLARTLFREVGVTHYVVMAEAWMVDHARADDPRPPSEHPDRIEVLFLAAVERGRCIARHYAIRRDGDAVTLELRPVPHEAPTIGGWMATLLDD